MTDHTRTLAEQLRYEAGEWEYHRDTNGPDLNGNVLTSGEAIDDTAKLLRSAAAALDAAEQEQARLRERVEGLEAAIATIACGNLDALVPELARLRAELARERERRAWQPIETAPEGQRCLLTNNLHATDAYGDMSHVWIGFPIRSKEEPGWVTFAPARVRGLTHWMPLPAAPERQEVR